MHLLSHHHHRLRSDGVTAGPVARLAAKQVEIRIRESVTNPPFSFAYTDPKKDFDVSGWMESSGGVELGITKVGGVEWWVWGPRNLGTLVGGVRGTGPGGGGFGAG